MGQAGEFGCSSVAFDPEITSALAAAYEKATDQLRGDGYTDLLREVLAKHIIAAAISGERGPDQLCTAALASIGVRD
jgi:hypothetical protein